MLAYDDADYVVTKAVKRIQAIEAAREAVKPIIGNAAMAMDSEVDLYSAALKAMGADAQALRGLQGSAAAVKSLFGFYKGRTGGVKRQSLAMDAKSMAEFNRQFPNANRLKHGGW